MKNSVFVFAVSF